MNEDSESNKGGQVENNQVALIFLSHRHDDKRIASVVRDTLLKWGTPEGRGGYLVTATSIPGAGIRAGDNLYNSLAKKIETARLVILIFTRNDEDWTWCAHECGLATTLPNDGSTKRRIIVFQCTDDDPKIYDAHKRVKINENDLQDFALQYWKEDNFFPGYSAVGGKNPAPDEFIRKMGSEFYNALKAVIPSPTLLKYNVPLITDEDLITKEQLVSKGGILNDPGQVVVRSAEPMERDYEFAKRVLSNIKEEVTYRYYFDKGVSKDIVARIIQTLAVAGIDELSEVETRKANMPQHADKIKQNLETISQRISIHFLNESDPTEYCVYNANEKGAAIAYLRYRLGNDRGWILMYSGEPVRQFVKARLPQMEIPPKGDPYVFRSTSEVDLGDQQNRSITDRLRNSVLGRFPEAEGLQIEAAVRCFGDVQPNQESV